MVRSPKSNAAAAAESRPVAPRCFYSTSIEGELWHLLGRPHYSYRFAEQRFLAAFARQGMTPQKLRMPEYYADREALGGAAGDDPRAPLVHLVFRSTEQIRVLKPAYNIACYAWEFAVMRDWTGPGEHPFLNQKRMLLLCDEIWVPCRYTRDVLAAHGIGRVHVIPAPIDVTAAPRLSRTEALALIGQVSVVPLHLNSLHSERENAHRLAAQAQSLVDWLAPRLKRGRDGAARVYLTVLNPDDFRKNLDSVLRGFDYFSRTHPEAVLIVKALTAPDRRPLHRIVSDLVRDKLDAGSAFASDNIVFFASYLAEDEMHALFCLADFYLCASMAEGQNLPLLEAMAAGSVPVTTANTAMLDYVDPEACFIVRDRPVAAPTHHLAGAQAGRPFSVAFSRAQDVHEALVRSAAAADGQLQAMASAARARVRERFSPAAVWPKIEARLAALPSAQP